MRVVLVTWPAGIRGNGCSLEAVRRSPQGFSSPRGLSGPSTLTASTPCWAWEPTLGPRAVPQPRPPGPPRSLLRSRNHNLTLSLGKSLGIMTDRHPKTIYLVWELPYASPRRLLERHRGQTQGKPASTCLSPHARLSVPPKPPNQALCKSCSHGQLTSQLAS